MNRGDVWLAQVGRKRRPIVVLTRDEVIDVRESVTVAEITTTIRGLACEVSLNESDAGLDRPSVVNCDGIHTVSRTVLTKQIGTISNDVLNDVCWAVHYALGC